MIAMLAEAILITRSANFSFEMPLRSCRFNVSIADWRSG
jgi:hypothetical protein